MRLAVENVETVVFIKVSQNFFFKIYIISQTFFFNIYVIEQEKICAQKKY